MSKDFNNLMFGGLVPKMWSPSSGHLMTASWGAFSKEIESATQKEIVVRQKISQIQAQKNKLSQNFSKNISEIEEEISEANEKKNAFIKVMNFLILKRRLDLISGLTKIVEEKDAKWKMQLKMCERALTKLENFKNKNSSFLLTDAEDFDMFCFNQFSQSLGEIDTGDIDFHPGKFNFFNELQKLLSCFSPPGQLHPKFILGEKVQLCRPWGVCFDAEGRILVSDRSNDRIVVFNEIGEYSFHFGCSGKGRGELNRPAGITVDKNNRIIVCDKDNHRIQVFDFNGFYIFEFGVFGVDKGQFHYPWDVSTNSSGDIAVSDSKNHRVQLFDSNGVFLTEFKSTYYKGFDLPRGLSFRPDDYLMVTDFNNHRVVVLNKSFKRAKIIGREGNGPGKLFRPQGITYLKNGYIAVSDSKNFRIEIYDKNGNYLNKFGTKGTEPGQFDCPQGLAYHPNGNLAVVDLSDNRVQVFQINHLIE